MQKIAVLYKSVHHHNTEKLLKEIQKEIPVDLYEVSNSFDTDLSSYDMVGFASGIYNQDMHKSLFDFVSQNPSLPRKSFILYTSGTNNPRYASKFSKTLLQRGIEVVDIFHCKGHDTYLKIFKPIGGIAKGHPNNKDIQKAITFVKNLVYIKSE